MPRRQTSSENRGWRKKAEISFNKTLNKFLAVKAGVVVNGGQEQVLAKLLVAGAFHFIKTVGEKHDDVSA